ncbi:MAG TPA: M50 family metallopeptidase [Brevundimonas sp.]|uniref:M50 family metallopeptidase n=1 Tax=Brevundimonas sp. TaxID=1871086 RepID=UPI002C744972|nr:M50 family metallopeptidase [Brevundimonas sp.]HRH19510.1 M50 family metallopeptidase [Brevundimonas sp.]
MLDFMGSILGTLAAFLAVLGLVVVIHELGHFSVAKLFGVKIDRFSIGFGKTIWSRIDKSGVEWRVAALPLGGYVKFSGDLDVTGVPDREGLEALKEQIVAEQGPGAERAYYHFKPIWQRALVVLAGPVANFLLAIAIFATLALALGETVLVKPRIGSIEAGSPAAAAGFQVGDLIVEADGRRIERWEDLQLHVSGRAGQPIRFEVDRAGQLVDLTATPGSREVQSEIDQSTIRMGYLGMGPSRARADYVVHRYNLPQALVFGVRQTGGILDSTLTYLGRIFTGRESGDQLSGPIGIARASGAIADQAVEGAQSFGEGALRLFFSLLTLAGLLSVAVGFFNLLPVPILDGGHLVFYAYEAVARRPLNAQFQEAGFRVGLALLVGLMLFATWNDLNKLNLFAFLGGTS